MLERTGRKQLILTAFAVTLCVFFFVSLLPSDAHALSLFDESGGINYAESLGFVFLMALMALFASEIPMILFSKTELLSKADIIEKLTFRLSIGLAVIVLVLEVTFLGLPFFAQIAWALTLVSLVVFAVRNRRLVSRFHALLQPQEKSRMARFRSQLVRTRANLAPLVVTFVLIGIFTFQASTIINGYVGSTNFDAGYHTLIIKSYLDTNMVQERPQPYYDFIVRYSRGPYTLSAYAVTLLSVPVQKIVVYMTLLFFALNMLAFYTLGKTAFGNHWMGLLVLGIGSSSQNLWSPISWGGLPFAMGLFSTLIGLSFVLRFVENARSRSDAALLGLILFLAVFSYPTSVLFVFAWFLFCLVAAFAKWFYIDKKRKVNFQARRLLLLSSVAVALGVGLSSTYIVTVNHELVSWITNPNQGTFPEIVRPQLSYLEEVQWVMDQIRQFNPLSPIDTYSFSLLHGYLLFFSSITPFAIVLFWLLKDRQDVAKEGSDRIFPKYVIAILFYLLFLFTFFYLGDLSNVRFILGNSFNDLIPPARVFQSFFVLMSVLSAVSVYVLVITLAEFPKAFFEKGYLKRDVLTATRRFLYDTHTQRKMCAFVVAACLVVYLGGSVSYYYGTLNAQTPDFVVEFRGVYGYFDRLSPSDLALMLWMKSNMRGDEVVFVNWQDGSEYVSAITGLRAIYVLSPLFESTRYQIAVRALSSNPASPSLQDFLKDYNITHVFVGSSGLEPRWNAIKIALYPNFLVVKNYGDSYLFEVKLGSTANSLQTGGSSKNY